MNIKRKKQTLMARAALLMLLVLWPLSGMCQRVLSLDSCRALALRNNKQMSVARVQQEVTSHLRKSARTQYLPKVNMLGGYLWTSREVSLLKDEQKSALGNMGTTASSSLQNVLTPLVSQLPPATQAKIVEDMGLFAGALNQVGQGIVDGFRTDTRNMFAGAVSVTQPVYMGGAIVAANKMADINEEMAANALEAKQQNTLFNIDHAYWQVVSLHHKQKLAESYVDLIKKLKGDVQKMIDSGMAIKGDGLSVGVRLNEAEIALMEVEDGLTLSKMLLCQLCGLPVDEKIMLTDEVSESQPTTLNVADALNYDNHPGLKVLQNTVDLSRQTTNLLKAGNLPQVLLTGGYAFSNPNAFNGFEKKFAGLWNVGVMLRVPVWNWGEVKHKIRASKGATTIASLELAEARELIELQVNQSRFRVNEAYKKLEMAQANVANADENLRMANLGFKEGTVSFTTVMEAQTAWQLAQSKKIDAEIGVRLSQVELQKALGTLK